VTATIRNCRSCISSLHQTDLNHRAEQRYISTFTIKETSNKLMSCLPFVIFITGCSSWFRLQRINKLTCSTLRQHSEFHEEMLKLLHSSEGSLTDIHTITWDRSTECSRKSSPLKFFANFSETVSNFNTQFYAFMRRFHPSLHAN